MPLRAEIYPFRTLTKPFWLVRPPSRRPSASNVFASATYLLLIVVFFLTQQVRCRRIRPTFPGGCTEKFWRHPCNIFPAGPCNASMRNVWRAEHGCARIKCTPSFARIVARRFIACRRRCSSLPRQVRRSGSSGNGADGVGQHGRQRWLPKAPPAVAQERFYRGGS